MERSSVLEKTDWPCETCGFRFSARRDLQLHLKRVNCGYQQCPKCERYFKTAGMSLHKAAGCKPLNCEICGSVFERVGNLSKHMKTHTGENRVNCPKCGTSICHKSALKKHLQICGRPKIQKTVNKIFCDLCGDFVNPRYRFQHFAKCHQNLGLGNFKSRFTTDSTIKCNHCHQEVVVQNYALHRHLELRPIINREFPHRPLRRCAKCDTKFMLGTIKHHDVVHQPLPDSKIQQQELTKTGRSCIFCGYVTSRYSLLENHMRTHTNEKPFYCNVCDEPFSSFSNLNRHFQAKHGPKKHGKEKAIESVVKNPNVSEIEITKLSPNIFCEMCKTTFKTIKGFESHFFYCGNPCRICGKKNFRSGQGRRLHLKAHLNKGEYKIRSAQPLLPKLSLDSFDDTYYQYNCNERSFLSNGMQSLVVNVLNSESSNLQLDPVYPCSKCGFFSTSRNDVFLHLKHQHRLLIPDHITGMTPQFAQEANGLQEIYRCCFCSMPFYSKMVAMDHMVMCQKRSEVQIEIPDEKNRTFDDSNFTKLTRATRANILDLIAIDMRKSKKIENVGNEAHLEELGKLTGYSVGILKGLLFF